MRYAIILMDGAADEPLTELNGKTVLEQANTPNTDWISMHGRQGMVHNIPHGFTPGSDVALMSVLGYNPEECYTGRAPLEAAAREIAVGPRDLVFRCNLITVADGILRDYSAGHIQTAEAAQLIAALNSSIADDELRFYTGISYRHLMVWRNCSYEHHIAPPHDIIDEPLTRHHPKGHIGRKLCRLMDQAGAILANHDVNKVRCDLGENPANGIWLWGQGRKPKLKSFRQRFGLSGVVITAVDLMRGLGKLLGMQIVEVEGATGYLDTNYAGKGKAALAALENRDLVFIHIEAPDEAGHNAMIDEKIRAIEQIDRYIVGPILDKWRHDSTEKWRIMVLPDHPTPIKIRSHTADAVPFAMAGDGISGNNPAAFGEHNARESGLHIEKGYDLMEYFIKTGQFQQ